MRCKLFIHCMNIYYNRLFAVKETSTYKRSPKFECSPHVLLYTYISPTNFKKVDCPKCKKKSIFQLWVAISIILLPWIFQNISSTLAEMSKTTYNNGDEQELTLMRAIFATPNNELDILNLNTRTRQLYTTFTSTLSMSAKLLGATGRISDMLKFFFNIYQTVQRRKCFIRIPRFT